MESDFNNCVTIIQVMISFFSDTLIIYLLLLPLNQGQTFYKVNNSAVCFLLLVIISGLLKPVGFHMQICFSLMMKKETLMTSADWVKLNNYYYPSQ